MRLLRFLKYKHIKNYKFDFFRIRLKRVELYRYFGKRNKVYYKRRPYSKYYIHFGIIFRSYNLKSLSNKYLTGGNSRFLLEAKKNFFLEEHFLFVLISF